MHKNLTVFLILLLSLSLLSFIPQAQATTIFSDGFESGDFSAWTGVTGTPSVQNTIKHTGTYAMLADVDAGGWEDNAYKDFTAASVTFTRFYCRFSAVPISGDTLYKVALIYQASSGNAGAEIKLVFDTTPKFQLRNNWFGNTVNGADVAVDTWYCVEVKTTDNIDNTVQKWWIDGVPQPDDASNGGNAKVDRVLVGARNFMSSNLNAYFDCVVADAYIGPEEEGQQVTANLTATVAVTDSLNTQKNLYRTETESLTTTETLESTKHLYRSTSETSSVTCIIETQKNIIVHMIVEVTGTTLISGLLETSKHLATVLFELFESVAVSSLLYTILPLIPLTVEDAVAVALLFSVVAIAICVGLIYYRRREDGTP